MTSTAANPTIIDLTNSDEELEICNIGTTRKRNGSHLASSPIPVKKRDSDSPPSVPVSSLKGVSRPPLPVRSIIKERIPEKNVRKLINYSDGSSVELSKNFHANVL